MLDLPVWESILILQMLFQHQQQKDALHCVCKFQKAWWIFWEKPHHFVHVLQSKVLKIRLRVWGGDRLFGLFRPPYHVVVILVAAVAVFFLVAPGRVAVHPLFIFNLRHVLPHLLLALWLLKQKLNGRKQKYWTLIKIYLNLLYSEWWQIFCSTTRKII